MHSSIHIPCSEAVASLLLQSIAIEVEDGPEGTDCQLSIQNGLQIELKGNDLSNFRAALNQVLRLVATVESVEEL